MRFVFDLDGTICSNTNGRYDEATPNFARIERINELFDQGHEITIHTARGMGSSFNDVDVASAAWLELTRTQLAEWGVQYHQLFMGKPAGDVYIDDKAVSDIAFFRSSQRTTS